VNEAEEELRFPPSYSLFSAAADDYSEPRHSDQLEQEMIDLITLQRLLNLAVDETPSKVINVVYVCAQNALHVCRKRTFC